MMTDCQLTLNDEERGYLVEILELRSRKRRSKNIARAHRAIASTCCTTRG